MTEENKQLNVEIQNLNFKMESKNSSRSILNIYTSSPLNNFMSNELKDIVEKKEVNSNKLVGIDEWLLMVKTQSIAIENIIKEANKNLLYP